MRNASFSQLLFFHFDVRILLSVIWVVGHSSIKTALNLIWNEKPWKFLYSIDYFRLKNSEAKKKKSGFHWLNLCEIRINLLIPALLLACFSSRNYVNLLFVNINSNFLCRFLFKFKLNRAHTKKRLIKVNCLIHSRSLQI